MTFLTCQVDIELSHVHGLKSMLQGMPIVKGCVIAMHLMYISVIFKLCLRIVTFIYETYHWIWFICEWCRRGELNRGLGMLEAGRILRAVLEHYSKNVERFQTHGNGGHRHSGGRERVITQYEDRFIVAQVRHQCFYRDTAYEMTCRMPLAYNSYKNTQKPSSLS